MIQRFFLVFAFLFAAPILMPNSGCPLGGRILFAAPPIIALAPPSARVEGTVSATSNGITIIATLQFQAPDKLRVQIEPNAAALVGAQTVVASGEETLSFDPQTRRVRRLNTNIVRQPWRDSAPSAGGAANLAIFGLDANALAQFYNTREDGVLAAKTSRMIQDNVSSGTSAKGFFYAVSKRRVFDVPPFLKISSDEGTLRSWTIMGPNSGVLSVTTIEPGADKLPVSATTRDAKNRVLTEWKYELKARAGAFDAATFALPDLAREQIVENVELRPLKEIDRQDDSFHLGVVQAQHLEDYAAAFAAWNAAAKQTPQATAPLFATYQAAMVTRDMARAQAALDALAQLLGEDSFEIASRRASLASQKRDWTAALAALKNAQKAQPQNLGVTLLRAGVLSGQGKFAESRALLLDIVKSDLPQIATQTAAAENLAASAWGEEIAALLAAIPQDTQAQKLARAHLQLLSGEKAESEGLTEPLALASLAVGLERERRDDAAMKIWQGLEARGGAAALMATVHLQSLAARRGDALLSLRAFRALEAAADGEAGKNRERSFLLQAWRKNFRQNELRGALEGTTVAAAARESDWNLWLAFLETNVGGEQVDNAVRAAAEKFDSAAWHSRLATRLLQMRAATPPGQEIARAALMKEAQSEARRAVELDADQPFYAMQLAFMALQRVGEIGIVSTPAVNVAIRDDAAKALDELERSFPDDADVALMLALGRKDLANRGLASINAVAAALRRGVPGKETASGNRHETLFFGRQAVALGHRMAKRYAQAESEYQTLFNSVQSPSEFAGIAINYLAMQNEQAINGAVNSEAVAAVFERAVAQTWSNAQSQSMLQTLGASAMRNRAFALRLGVAMSKGNAARAVAGAQLLFELESLAGSDASKQGAPAQTEKFWRQTQAAALEASNNLTEIATGEDTLAASRATVILAERALLAGDAKNGARLLQVAITYEPQDLELRLILVRALLADKRPEEALAARDAILKTLPRDGETLRRVASLSLQLDLKGDAVRLATWAQNQMQIARDATPVQLEIASFILARALMANGHKDEAGALYQKLAGDQWGNADRTAALLDWQAQLRLAGDTAAADGIAARLRVLSPSKRNKAGARALLQSLE